MKSFPRSRGVWAWASLGLVGSLLTAVAGPASIPDNNWWYAPGFPGGRSVAMAAVFVGAALLAAGWIGLARYAAGERTGWLVAIAAAWLTPLALAPPLFSGDVYSYIAQGTILHLGHNPYNTAPAALAGLHQSHVMSAVSPFWRHTTSPYGPLLLGLMSVVVSITGSHLIAGVLVTRALELVGVGLLAVYVPRLARALGADRARATWLAVLSPLMALELIAAAHNDVLMIGLLVAGVTVALQGRPIQGVALCALAATVKLPAFAGVLFIAVAWARSEPDRSERVKLVVQSALAALGVLAAVSIVTGLGFSWLTTSVFSTPAKVHLAITPSTAAGWTVAGLLRDAGVAVGHRTVASAFGVVTLAITIISGALLLWRVRVPKVALYLGLLLLIAAACGPAAWPWYFSWGLVLLAACPGVQRSVALATGAVVGIFLIKPNGILVLPVQSAPAVLAAYALIALVAWRSRHLFVPEAPIRAHEPDAGDETSAPQRSANVSTQQDLTRA
jgi:alpha-1,6-mannosyltransferase